MNESLLANTRISHYRILSQIGVGGMGEVYLAEDTTLDRKVALKLLPAEFTTHRDRLGRFIQEAKAAAALSHPNVAHIYEVNESAGWHFIAMEYIEGETLRHRLAHRKLSLSEALEVAIQVVNALASAHAAGVVHRDIKPENIMLRSDSYVKVLDFGLAKLTEKPRASATDSEMATVARVDTDPGTVLGTSRYMSPEQARGKQVDARSDIFSLGVVLYEMIAGQPPFQGETTGDVIVALLDREPVALTRVSPETPAELQRIVSKALRKDKEERYQTSKDLLVDLRSLKQELEFEVKLERSIHPEANVVRMTGLGSGLAVTPAAVAFASSGADLRSTSSAEYLISEIRKRKRVAAVILSGVAVTVVFAYLFYFTGDSKTIDSIAVLPLVNTSADPNAEYLSDGITESLINNLTQLPKLRVVARSTVFRYKGKEVDPQQVGRELNVRAVLMGRVLQRGEMLTMQVDLVNVSDGSQIWGQQYNRKAADLVAVQQDIAREVTEKLRLRLSGEEQKQLTKRDSANADAYQSYLKGRFYWNKRTADGINKAIEQFQQAIDKDPNYALAHVGLADCYLVLEQYAGTPASDTLPKAKSAAQRALQIDESLAEVHSSLGLLHEFYWQWEEAEREYKRAISLNPNYPTVHHWYSIFLRSVGRFDEAATEINRAQQLDPLSPIISRNVVDTHLLKGDLDAALEECKKTIELNPNFPPIRMTLAWAYLKQQRFSEAIAELQKAVELSGGTSEYLGELGHVYAVAGRRVEALAVLRQLEQKYAKRESPGKDLAAVYVGLGEKEQSLSWIEKDLQQQSSTLHFVLWYPTFDPLRSEARYTAMLRRMRLTSATDQDKGAR